MSKTLILLNNNAFSSVGLIFSLSVLFVLLSVLSILLPGVYHTLAFVSTCLWNSVIVAVSPAIVFILTLGVIFLKQPVQNLLCLISIFFGAVLLYLYAGAEYLAFLFLIVYVGAIAILFLFVVMLLHIKKSEQSFTLKAVKPFIRNIFFVTAICFCLNDALSFAIQKNNTDSSVLLEVTEPTSLSALRHYVLNKHSDILSFADILYRKDAVLFFLVSFLLLTAMIGAIVLATNTTETTSTAKTVNTETFQQRTQVILGSSTFLRSAKSKFTHFIVRKEKNTISSLY